MSNAISSSSNSGGQQQQQQHNHQHEQMITGVKAMSNVTSSIEAIERDINKLTSKGDLASLTDQLTSLEGAKIEVATAFTLATMMYMVLKVQGVDCGQKQKHSQQQEHEHPIHMELKRIKEYVGRVNKAAAAVVGESSASVSTSAVLASAALAPTVEGKHREVTAAEHKQKRPVFETQKTPSKNSSKGSSHNNINSSTSSSKKARKE